MPTDTVTSIRMAAPERDAVAEIARRMTQSLGKRVTISNVVRLAVQDYLRRNG